MVITLHWIIWDCYYSSVSWCWCLGVLGLFPFFFSYIALHKADRPVHDGSSVSLSQAFLIFKKNIPFHSFSLSPLYILSFFVQVFPT